MNILLTAAGIIGKDEFVTSPAPNTYITVLRITPKQAAHFGGNERIGIQTVIAEDDAYANEVYGVGDDNKSNDWKLSALGEEAKDPARAEILLSLEDRELAAITAFLEAVGHDDLEVMYQELEDRDFADKLRTMLGMLKA